MRRAFLVIRSKKREVENGGLLAYSMKNQLKTSSNRRDFATKKRN